MKISLIGITEKSAFPRKEINTTSAIAAQNVPIDSACKGLSPLILKYTEYTDQNAAALINIKCPRQVPLEDVKSISQIAIDSAPAIIQSKPNCLTLLGRSPINKKALKAAQNGSVPGAKIPASDAGANCKALDRKYGNRALAPTVNMNTPITFVPLGGTTPNFNITGDKIIAAGTILRIKISSTEKFEETA